MRLFTAVSVLALATCGTVQSEAKRPSATGQVTSTNSTEKDNADSAPSSKASVKEAKSMNSESKPPQSATPALSSGNQVRNEADLNAKGNAMVEVFGTYIQVAVGKAPNSKPRGHAALRLEDDTHIYLQPPWSAAGIRPAEEIAKYDGKPVVASGLLIKKCPGPGEERAYAEVSCMYSDFVLRLQSTSDSSKK